MASAVGVGLSFAVFSWRVIEAERDADVGWWRFTEGPLLFAVAAVAVVCAVVVAVRLVRGSPLGDGTWPAFAWTIAGALLAAIPIGFSYNDGCNDHAVVSAVGAAPVIVLAKPDAPVGAYNDIYTLMACRRIGQYPISARPRP